MKNNRLIGRIIGKISVLQHQRRYLLSTALLLAVGIGVSVAVWSLFFVNTINNLQNLQMSSFSKNLAEIHKAEIVSISRLSVNRQAYNAENVKLPKRFEANPAFKLFAYLKGLAGKQDQVTVRKIAVDAKTNEK